MLEKGNQTPLFINLLLWMGSLKHFLYDGDKFQIFLFLNTVFCIGCFFYTEIKAFRDNHALVKNIRGMVGESKTSLI